MKEGDGHKRSGSRSIGKADIAVRVTAALGAAFLLFLFALHGGEGNYAPTQQKWCTEESENNESVEQTRQWCTDPSVAQWLLVLLNFAAVAVSGVTLYWLKKTFDATFAMAADTRRIGEAQVRAYIYPLGAEIDPVANTLDVLFKNYGSSPGTVTFVDCFVDVSDMYPHKNLWDQRFWSDGFTVAPQDTHRQKFRLDAGRAGYLERMIAEEGIRTVVQGNFQSVDVFRHTHAHPLHIVLADGIRR